MNDVSIRAPSGMWWLVAWCVGSLVSPAIAFLPLLTISLGGHSETWLVVSVVVWAVGVYALGSGLGQARAIGLHKMRRVGWIGLKVVLDLTTLASWSAEHALGYGPLLVLVSVGVVLLCGMPLAWYLSRLVDKAGRAYAYAAAATLLFALAATSGPQGNLRQVFGHPFGQLLLRDIGFGIALWYTARATANRA